MEILTKTEIAERQLNRSIALILNEIDIVSAITLAGAAEDVLAGILKTSGKTDQLTDTIKDCISLGKSIGHDWKNGDFRYEFNFMKNEMKHHDNGLDEILVHSYSAVEIIGRAIENFRKITGRYSDEMNAFQAKFC